MAALSSDGSSAAGALYASSSTASSSTALSSSVSSSTSLAFPTARYTGQAILIGTCNIPQYTALSLYGGAVIEVPLVGCSDDRPECCPSLSPPESTSTESSTVSQQSSAPYTTSPPSTTSPTATGVISKLSASPLSVCPQDFTDIDPVCCPRGYRLYGQAVIGGITPCYSMLSTSVPLSSAESASIVSEIAATASATATISVIVNQVYALGLPCGNDIVVGSGLSTGAKAGIGVGAGVGGLILISLAIIIGLMIGRGRPKREQERAAYEEALGKPNVGPMATPLGMGSPYTEHSRMSTQPPNMYGYAPNPAYSPQPSHPSWTSGAPTIIPPYGSLSPVEMQTEGREIHEIGDRDNSATPPKADSSLDQNIQSFNITVYEPHEAGNGREVPPR